MIMQRPGPGVIKMVLEGCNYKFRCSHASPHHEICTEGDEYTHCVHWNKIIMENVGKKKEGRLGYQYGNAWMDSGDGGLWVDENGNEHTH
jgi:hypothetical protein